MNNDDARQASFGQTPGEPLKDVVQTPTALDLRSIPREEWPRYLHRELQLPSPIDRYISGQSTFSDDEVCSLEFALEKHHGITAPFAVYLMVPAKGRATAHLIRE